MPSLPETFLLEIKLGYESVQTPEDVADLLEKTAKYMRRHGSWPREKVMSIDGNTVGRVVVV